MIVKVFCPKDDIPNEKKKEFKNKLAEVFKNTTVYYHASRNQETVTISPYNHEVWPATKLDKIESQLESILFGDNDEE